MVGVGKGRDVMENKKDEEYAIFLIMKTGLCVSFCFVVSALFYSGFYIITRRGRLMGQGWREAAEGVQGGVRVRLL